MTSITRRVEKNGATRKPGIWKDNVQAARGLFSCMLIMFLIGFAFMWACDAKAQVALGSTENSLTTPSRDAHPSTQTVVVLLGLSNDTAPSVSQMIWNDTCEATYGVDTFACDGHWLNTGPSPGALPHGVRAWIGPRGLGATDYPYFIYSSEHGATSRGGTSVYRDYIWPVLCCGTEPVQ